MSYTGRGKDRLGTKKDKLNLKWYWGWHGHKEKEPGQVCAAYVDDFELRVVEYSDGYEARLAYCKIDIFPKPFTELRDRKYNTRLQAQQAAEMLPFEFAKEVISLMTKSKL